MARITYETNKHGYYRPMEKKRLKVIDDQQGCHSLMNDKEKVIN